VVELLLCSPGSIVPRFNKLEGQLLELALLESYEELDGVVSDGSDLEPVDDFNAFHLEVVYGFVGERALLREDSLRDCEGVRAREEGARNQELAF